MWSPTSKRASAITIIYSHLNFQERQVAAIVRHPDFDLGTHENNFAILFLEGVGFEAMPHIAPALLPSVMRILVLSMKDTLCFLSHVPTKRTQMRTVWPMGGEKTSLEKTAGIWLQFQIDQLKFDNLELSGMHQS